MPNDALLSDIPSDNETIEIPYVEDCEADMDLVDLVEAAELKGYIING